MNDLDVMPGACADCPYWELAKEPYVCFDCLRQAETRGKNNGEAGQD